MPKPTDAYRELVKAIVLMAAQAGSLGWSNGRGNGHDRLGLKAAERALETWRPRIVEALEALVTERHMAELAALDEWALGLSPGDLEAYRQLRGQ